MFSFFFSGVKNVKAEVLNHYYYDELDAESKLFYDTLYEHVENGEESFYYNITTDLTVDDVEKIDKAFTALLYDHVEISWVRNLKYSYWLDSDKKYVTKIKFTPLYYSDVTWGDMENKNSDYVTDIDDYISYSYMLEPESEFCIDHKSYSTYVALPTCNSEKNEYFHKEGLYFTEFGAKQRQIVQDKLAEGKTFQIKCFVPGITNAARNYLYTLDWVYGLNIDDDRNIITVFVQDED